VNEEERDGEMKKGKYGLKEAGRWWCWLTKNRRINDDVPCYIPINTSGHFMHLLLPCHHYERRITLQKHANMQKYGIANRR